MSRIHHPVSRALPWAAALALLAGCQGGTPWGATPQQIPIPEVRLPDLSAVPAHVEASTTAGAQRLAERVRAALLAQPSLGGTAWQVDGLEGGLIVLGGAPANPAQRQLALQTARQVPGVREVVDRMAAP